MIEEMMLFANNLVGKHLVKHLKTKALLRKHDRILAEKMENLHNYFQYLMEK